MLQYPLVNRLLHNLENAILHDAVASDESRPRRHDFGDECVGTEGIGDEVASPVHQGAPDHGEGGEEHRVAVTDVGKCHWIIVAPGREC